MGLGRKSTIELTGETAGILPSDAWKRVAMHEGWRAGDTCNFSIGQGALAVTPMQMAVMTAAVANGGRVFRPRLILQPARDTATSKGGSGAEGDAQFREGEQMNSIKLSEPTLKVVRAGMFDVVQSPTGTGKRALVPGIEIAAKTGTAEFGRKGEGNKRVWMVAYAPFNKPQYAAVVTLERGESGGRTVAPRMQKLLAGIFNVSLPAPGEPAPAPAPAPSDEVIW